MCLFIDVLAMYIPTGVERIIERAAIPVKHPSRLLPEVKYKNILQRKAFSLNSISYLARMDECQYQFKGTKGQGRTDRNSFCNRFLNSNVTIIYKRPWVPKRCFSSLSHWWQPADRKRTACRWLSWQLSSPFDHSESSWSYLGWS